MGEFTVSRATSITAPPHRVHGLINDFRAWPVWSPWEDLDPDLRRTYSGAEVGLGSHYAWEGNRHAGAGSMEITDSTPDRICVRLEFRKPFRATHLADFELTPTADGTDVVWTMTGTSSGLSALFMLFADPDKLIGPDFERGLGRLRSAAQT